MTTAGVRPVAIKIDTDIKERVKRLADARQRTPHRVMREALRHPALQSNDSSTDPMHAHFCYHACMGKQLTIRGVSAEINRRLTRLSRNRGQSVNSTALQILEGAVGIDARRQRLQHYATWSAADLAEFENALAGQRVIDDALWR